MYRKKFAYCGIVRKTLVVLNDFFDIEAVGPSVLLENFPDQFRGSLWLHFLDNAAALSNLVNGSSSNGTSLLAKRGAKYSVCRFSHGLTVWIRNQTLQMGFPGDGWMGLGRSNP